MSNLNNKISLLKVVRFKNNVNLNSKLEVYIPHFLHVLAQEKEYF